MKDSDFINFFSAIDWRAYFIVGLLFALHSMRTFSPRAIRADAKRLNELADQLDGLLEMTQLVSPDAVILVGVSLIGACIWPVYVAKRAFTFLTTIVFGPET